MEPQLGVTIGRYEIVRLIGEGGMAQVYLSIRRGVGGFAKRVVLKIPHAKYIREADYIRMFLDEARLLAQLQHPNIVDVFEVESVDGIPYVAMEYVNGPTLGKLHKRAARARLVDLGHLLHIVVQVCQGLHYAHSLKINGAPAGIIHRDVSSQNILIDAETGVAKIIDFGIAKMGDDSQAKTQVGVLKGKITYMAPELLRGARPDARIDIYAVGVLLYRLVTNRLPFAEGDDIWAARIAGRYAKASELKPEISPQLDAIIDRALHPDPDSRYQTAAELAVDLQAELARMKSDPGRMVEWIRTVFPGGEDEWSRRSDAGALTQTTESALSRIVSDPNLEEVRSMTALSQRGSPTVRRVLLAGIAVPGAIALAGVALVGIIGLWALSLREPSAPSALRNAETYLDEAEALLAEHRFDAARAMNARADEIGVDEADVVIRIARQRSTIEREQALFEARAHAAAGRPDEARGILAAALEADPSDQQLRALLAEITPPAPEPEPAAPEPAAPEPAAPEPAPAPEVAPEPARAAAPVRPVRRAPPPTHAASPTPERPPALTGTVEIAAIPSGLIFFDGRLVGESRVRVSNVLPGEHTAEARLEGYRRERITFVVQGSEPIPVRLQLTAEP